MHIFTRYQIRNLLGPIISKFLFEHVVFQVEYAAKCRRKLQPAQTAAGANRGRRNVPRQIAAADRHLLIACFLPLMHICSAIYRAINRQSI